MDYGGQKERLLGGGEDAPLIDGAVTYNSGPRAARDRPWGVAFLIFLGISFVGGVFCVTFRNPVALTVFTDPHYLNDPHHCPSRSWPASDRRRDAGDVTAEVMAGVAKVAMTAVAVSMVVSLLLGILTLWLNKSHPRAMVYTTVLINVGIMTLCGVATVRTFVFGGALFFLSAFCLLAMALWFRESLDLCAALMKVAGQGVDKNKSILGVSMLMEVLNLVLLLPLIAFVCLAFTNGHVVARENVQYDAKRGFCHSIAEQTQGLPVTCCEWQPSMWAMVYMAQASFTMLWMIMLMGQIRLFTVSGTIAQWYFAPTAHDTVSRGRITNSLKNALGPQFGSLCEASLILAVVQMIKQEAQEQQREGGAGAFLVACLVQCIGAIVEKLTKFSTIVMSITGQAFFDSAATTYDLLTRNMLSTVTVWWLPGMVLSTFTLVVSTAFAAAVGTASYAHWASASSTADIAVVCAVLLGCVVWILAIVILGFFTGILLNVIDTVFICFAIDADRRTSTRPDVHEVYMKVPNVAKAVEAGCWAPNQVYTRPPM